MQRPRDPSVVDGHPSQLHLRAGKFLQKLSTFSQRRKGSVGQIPYQFLPRPVGSAKPYMSQPALGLHTSDSSPDNDGSSHSGSPNASSPSSRHNHSIVDVGHSLAGLTNSGSTSALCTFPPTFSPINPDTPRSVSPITSLHFPSYSPPCSPSHSVGFDVPRGLLNARPMRDTAFGVSKSISTKRSVDAVSNKNTDNAVPDPSMPPSNPVLMSSPVIGATGWSSVVDASGVPKIEGLPPSSPGEARDVGWLRQSYSSKFINTKRCSGSQAASGGRAVTSVSFTSQKIGHSELPPDAPTVAIPPPTYEQVANWLPGKTDLPNVTPRRSALLRLSSLPPSVFRMEGSTVRLSPSVINRNPPLPIMSLPTLQVTEGSTPSSGSGARARLRSMPALPMEGSHDDSSDHENGNSGDEDEDNDMEDESDGEDDHGTTETENPVTIAGPSSEMQRVPSFSTASLSPISVYATPGDITPASQPGIDYFSSKPQQAKSAVPLLTPLEWDPALKQRLTAFEASKPSRSDLSIYRRPSKSMVDLLSTKQCDMPTTDEEIQDKGKAKDTTPVADQATDDLEARGSRLKRQMSLPVFTAASDPPPYPSFEKFTVQPREEEGKEKLPIYTNSIYLSAVLPRKLEFSAPGVQSTDRKWRRSLCILEGTALKIFNPPPGMTGVSALGSWWERKVGVGNLTSTTPAPISKRPPRPTKGEESQSPSPVNAAYENPDVNFPKKKRSFASGFLSRSTNNSGPSSRRQSIDASREEGGSRMRQSFSVSRPNLNGASFLCSHTTSITNSTTVRASSDGRNVSGSVQSAECVNPNPGDPIRVYTSQRAESGLASDYIKRKNVIRVRMEGEQFLLQAPNVSSVVEWIEGFQAAANVALDLEERPMPKGPAFPRRRRRARPPEPAATTS